MEEVDQHQSTTHSKPVDAAEASFEVYSWPVIKFDVPPHRTYHFYQQFRNTSNPNNFLKGVKWSPDGCCFLTSSEDNTLRAFTLPRNDSDDTPVVASSSASDEVTDSYAADIRVSEGESVYDYCWYPYMSSSDPTTCVFASTTRDHPIHLWDATSGQLRCTYRAYDAMDEITAAFSIAFNPYGTRIFAGYNKSVRLFDLHRPGRDFEQFSTLQGNKEGQSGIISAIAFSPTHTGMLAMGSYDQTTAIYREDNMELLYVLHGQGGGITHVQFSRDGNYLYTGGRKDPFILCWDIRNSVEIVYKLYRSTEQTNQRIFFDIEPSGRHLGTGGQDGLVHIYDLQTGQWTSSFQAASVVANCNVLSGNNKKGFDYCSVTEEMILNFELKKNTVNGFSFHPFLPMAASSSGERRFGIPDDCSDDFKLGGDENCASVWSFFYTSMTENSACVPFEELNGQAGHEQMQQDGE